MSHAPERPQSSAHRDGLTVGGTLQRLGARALGQGWTVRSDVRLPFAADRCAEPAPGAGGPTAATETPYAATVPSPAPPLRAPLPSGADEPSPSAALLQAPRATSPDRDYTPPWTRQRNAPPDPTSPAMAVETGSMAAVAPVPAPGAPSHASDQAMSRSMPPMASTLLPPVLPPEPAPLLPDHGAEGTGHPASPAHRVPSVAARQAAGPTPASPAPTGETEVHIRIGRIEVTALQEAPRAKARPRERAQPMSLDAYLEQRRKAS